MSAWALAWIEPDEWRNRLATDPTSREALGSALTAPPGPKGSEANLSGFGCLQHDGLPVTLESVPPRLLMWSAGELVLYIAEAKSDVEAFLKTSNSGSAGAVLIFAVEYDEACRQSDLDVGEAVAQLLSGARDTQLGPIVNGARVCAEVAWDATVTFAWHRNALSRTDMLSASSRHEITELLAGTRRAPEGPDTRLRAIEVSILRAHAEIG